MENQTLIGEEFEFKDRKTDKIVKIIFKKCKKEYQTASYIINDQYECSYGAFSKFEDFFESKITTMSNRLSKLIELRDEKFKANSDKYIQESYSILISKLEREILNDLK